MSCIGIYKRNAIDLNGTLKLLYLFLSYSVFVSVSSRTIVNLGDTFSNTTRFWIWSIQRAILDTLVFILPFSFVLPDDTISANDVSKLRQTSDFYVRKPPPVLEPRRPFYKQDNVQKYSQADVESSIDKKHTYPKCQMYCKVHGETRILPPMVKGPASIIQVKEWTDNSRCKGKGKGTGKGKCKGKCPAKNKYYIGRKYSPFEAEAV
jgi:hypothetical protein